MAYLESDRVQVRHFVGFGSLFLQADPRLEAAITASQAVTDPGGTRPDNTTELAIKGYVNDCQTVEARFKVLWNRVDVSRAEEVNLDAVRGIRFLRSEGRRLSHSIARLLGMKGVRADIWGPGPVIKDTDPFSSDDNEYSPD